jgi:TetR/AcrR family transcriptional repressor of lmrAB and yxaGH operons
MSGKKPTHRDRIVRAASKLLRQRGYSGTGLADIVALSGAPKGSIYHYFPQGKDQIAAEALRYAGRLVSETVTNLCTRAETPADALRAYGALLAGWMADSGFMDGCPITTTVLQTAPANAELAEAGRNAFAEWSDALRIKLVDSGLPPERARRLAGLAIMALEGALILARVEASKAPIVLATEEVAALFERECDGRV